MLSLVQWLSEVLSAAKEACSEVLEKCELNADELVLDQSSQRPRTASLIRQSVAFSVVSILSRAS